MMSKWICIKDRKMRNITIKEGHILEGGFMQIGIDDPEDKIFYCVYENENYFHKFHWKYFMQYEKWLAKFREEQIKTILDD